jgi:hypothetical protein
MRTQADPVLVILAACSLSQEGLSISSFDPPRLQEPPVPILDL